MMRSRSAALVVLVTACSSPPPEWHEEDGYRWQELRVSGRRAPGFTAVDPGRAGIDFANTVKLEAALDNEHLLVGSGLALGDVDGDGRTDIYLARLDGPNVLYRNLGDWQFEDVTDSAGVAAAGRYSTGAAMADVDGDGSLDLVVTSLGGPDVVFRNDGSGRFTEIGDAGLADGLGTTTTALADVDGDGDLDLYVVAYKSESATELIGAMGRSPTALLAEARAAGGADTATLPPELQGHYRIEERYGERILVEQADADRLYLNDGEGRFRPVSWVEGAFVDEAGEPLERDLDDFGLAARFYDVDGDGDPDLYVCNDFDDPDQLWLNRGDGTFEAAPRLALRSTSHASMSVDFADIDRNGHVDMFVAEMRTRDPRRRLMELPFQRRLLKPVGVIEDRPQIQRNTLFWNRGDGTFAEIAELAGVDASEWTWGSMFLDVDLDGYEDLLVANGYSRDTQHGDVIGRMTRLQGRATIRELNRLYEPLPNRNVAFRNRGDLTFEDASDAWNVGEDPDISHGLAAGDLDGDGDLDVVINRLDAPVRLLRNDSRAPRVAVRLLGRGENTRGIGAKVRLSGGSLPVQEREVAAGGLYLSSAEPLTVFAAEESRALTLEVEWPGGVGSVVSDVAANRIYEIREEGPWEPANTGDGPDREASADPGPLFVDRSDRLGHRHVEDTYEDFQRQPLLPYQPGRLGPGVSWIDVDRDGDPDLVVTPGAGGPLSLLRNEDGRFQEVVLEDSAPLDRSAAVPLPTPDGGWRLLIGSSSYQAPTMEAIQREPPVLSVPLDSAAPTPTPLIVARSGAPGPAEFSSTGPLALADVDGDQDLDLFVGGRIIAGFYPVSASSRLFRNDDGELRPDTLQQPGLDDLGMVSGAVFSDVDGDGDPDLLLAVEWGPVRLLLNDGGRFTDATESWGLDGLRGRWNGITAGDLNGDGRMDVVVTGWGRNVRDRPLPSRPLVLFHDDVDGSGSWDLLLTRQASDGVFIPLTNYRRLQIGIPSLPTRVPTFEAFAEASVEDILGRPQAELYRKPAYEYDHLLLLNRGGRFDAEPLPLEAQFAPSMGVAVGDLDGDGAEDVFLAQNFFPTHVDQPRFDGGLGLMLRGDGAGGLEPVPATRSGIRAYGDQRGVALADYDRDGRVDLALAQNGAETRLFRNVGARPGLRVRLEGPPGNPDGIGAVVRVLYAAGPGPAREVHAGSGYWSMNDAVQVFGLSGEPVAVQVRWPGGQESRVPVPADAREVTVSLDP